MTIKIKIENCKSINEFYQHLLDLEDKIKKHTKKSMLQPLKDEFTKRDSEFLNNHNYYGERYVTISNPKL